MSKIGLMDVKKALRDSRFRLTLPASMNNEVNEYLNNPGCPCHVPFFKKILKECKEQLQKYFPSQEIMDEQEEVVKLAQNDWSVINCHIDELEEKLKKLGPGRFQLDVARYLDQVTVVINRLEHIF